MKRVHTLFFVLAALLFFPGCSLLSMLGYGACGLTDDNSHCYQSMAVQSSDTEACEKVSSPESFASVGSNPPRDKCYNMIAVVEGDEKVCGNIVGGPGSYSQDGCVGDVAQKTEKFEVCNSISIEDAVAGCVNTIAATKLNRVDETLKKAGDVENLTPEEMAKIQEDMQAISQVTELLSGILKAQHSSASSAIMNLR